MRKNGRGFGKKERERDIFEPKIQTGLLIK
jgi:hypothetical protein